MKKRLSFKHLFITFGASLASLFLSPSLAKAVNLCASILQNPPTAQQVNESLDAYTQLTRELDLSKVQGDLTSSFRILQGEEVQKKNELVSRLQISESEFRELIRARNKFLDEKKQTKHIKKIQDDTILEALPNYVLKKQWDIRRLDDGVLSSDGKNLFTISKTPNEVQIIKLETGEVSLTAYDYVLILKDRILINKDSQWSSLDTNSATITPLKTTLPATLTFISSKASVNKDTFVIFHGSMGNGPKDRLVYQLFNRDGVEIDKGDVYTGFAITDIPYVSDQYWIVQRGVSLYKFFPQSKNLVPLAAEGDAFFPIPDTNKILASTSGDVHLIDLDTNHIETRKFKNLARPFFANKERIWISERDSNKNAHFHLIKVSDFQKSDESLPDQPNFLLREIPDTEWVVFQNQYFNDSTQPGIYHQNNLGEPAFIYDSHYNPGSGTQIHLQWISKDGSRIVTTVMRGGLSPRVDIWDKEAASTQGPQ